MELASALKTLWRLRLAVAVGMFFAVLAAYAAAYRVAIPPKFEPRGIEYGIASTQILIDTPNSPLADIRVDPEPLASRADLFARFVESEPVQRAIAKEGKFPHGAVVIGGRIAGSAAFSRVGREASAEQRALAVSSEREGRRILFAAEQGLPVLTVLARAPSATEAAVLARAGADGLIKYVSALQAERRTPTASRIRLTRLGEPQGGIVNPGARQTFAFVVMVGFFIGWCLLVLVVNRVVHELRRRPNSVGCLNCGSEIPEQGKFCSACGRPAGDAPRADKAKQRDDAPDTAASAA